MCGSASAEMPMPLSCTRNSQRPPACRAVVTRIAPFSGVNLIAFMQHIPKHLLEPCRVRGDQRGGIVKFGFKSNAFFPHLRAVALADMAHGFVEID